MCVGECGTNSRQRSRSDCVPPLGDDACGADRNSDLVRRTMCRMIEGCSSRSPSPWAWRLALGCSWVFGVVKLESNIIPAVVRTPGSLARCKSLGRVVSRPRAAAHSARGRGAPSEFTFSGRPARLISVTSVALPPITKVGVDARRHTRNCSQLAAP